MLTRTASLVFAAWVLLCFTVLSSKADVLHSWVQLGPNDQIIVRAISASTDCPLLQIDGQAVAMKKRAMPQDQFPHLVCEYRAPKLVQKIMLEGNPLPTLNPSLKRIAVVGDTGCRIRGTRVQYCNDPTAWPLNSILVEIASRSPDLVIHVGDYVYRASECPDPEKCGGSPFGDTFKSWSADWLDPADSLFRRVPFFFLRGNHENCGRGNKGWFRYFEAGSLPSSCPAVTLPWIASVEGLDLISFDSSAGPAPQSSPGLSNVYGQMARDLFGKTSGEAWLLTHRPLWVNMQAFGELIDGDDTQRAAFSRVIPENVNLVLSGHIHAFQAIDLLDGPVQGISGNGGTQLDPMPTEIAANVEVAGSLASIVVSNSDFGFLMLTQETDGSWSMDAIDAAGKTRNRCRLSGRTLSCE
ncbi:Calcineurin-like phosphoesterase [Ruegeria atlantica]|uniref:Calcineurin-like phosphoesterase n=2 Tax=Ruegeria atlantica TaxID=81569 RepID=A0A0P1EY86_9RHOB|nr:Calcineurin-like phosphoesterase [Ruegeria atlantica]